MTEYSEEILDIYKKAIECPKVPMVLRVAVAGKRDLSSYDDPELDRVRAALKQVYRLLEGTLDHMAHLDKAESERQWYLQNGTHRLRFISSLAEGMDRICIEQNLLPDGSELGAITPFLLEDFRKDFEAGASVINPDEGTEQEFDEILDRLGYGTSSASLIELDGDTEHKEDAYLNCCKVLVDRADLLVAVYPFDKFEQEVTGADSTIIDQRDHNKQTACPGTAATISFAKENRLPVIEINLNNPEEIRICHTDGRKGDICNINLSEDKLKSLLEEKFEEILFFADSFNSEAHRKLQQSQIIEEHSQGQILSAVRECQNQVIDGFSAYKDNHRLLRFSKSKIDFDFEGPIELVRSSPKFWPNLFKTFIDWMSYTKGQGQHHYSTEAEIESKVRDASSSIAGIALHQLNSAFLRADRIANYYSAIHRTSFLLLYILGAFAIVCAGSALVLSESQGIVKKLVIVELCTLFAIWGIYRYDHIKYHYHQRWLEYRCLAEFLRPLVYISTLGRSFPVLSFHLGDEFYGRTKVGHGGPGNNWVTIYMAMLIRYVGFNHVRLDRDNKRKIAHFIREKWLIGQKVYHTKNAGKMELITERLEKFGKFCFFTTLVVLVVKVVGSKLWHDMPHWFSVFASYIGVVLPVMAATSVAIANHGEFAISNQRSRTMAALLTRKIDLLMIKEDQLSTKELVAHVDQLAKATMKEVSDWLEIYEVKKAELG